MTKKTMVHDKNGRAVEIGTRVKVLALPTGVTDSLEPEEVERVKSMVGDVLEVDEIDMHGCAWVTKWWGAETESPEAHSLALSAHEMEVV
jgi:hypothetical protein